MLIFLTILLGTLSSMVRSRVAVELENVALRHEIGVLQTLREKTLQVDPSGPQVLGLAVPVGRQNSSRNEINNLHSFLNPSGAARISMWPHSWLNVTLLNDDLASERARFLAANVSDGKGVRSGQNFGEGQEIDRKYDYRYSQLDLVFGRLLQEKWIVEEELRGLGEEKLEAIPFLRQVLRWNEPSMTWV